MSFWTADNIKAVVGGAWLARDTAGGEQPPITGVSTDSRAVKAGELFIALRGERTDGHEYLAQAVASGARLLLVQRPESVPTGLAKSVGVLHVADTGAALLKLGAAYRRTLETTRVIAVGGSNGKTTTCKLLHAVLSRTLRGSVSPKSFNNAVGVPLTILAAKRSDQYLICEVGTNAPGEIAPLAGAVSPDIAVITSIGREHLEGLGSLRGVVAEEASLTAAIRPGGLAVVNADAPTLMETVRGILTSAATGAEKPRSMVSFGQAAHADLRVGDVTATPEGVAMRINGREAYRLPLLGGHNALNAAAVVAVARRLGVPQAEIEAGLAGAKGPEMRMERADAAGVRFVNDAYNANPESALAAIRGFASAFAGAAGVSRRVLVLGDMLELGEAAPDLHREVGDAAAEAGVFDLVILVGGLVLFAGERLGRTLGPDRIVPFPDAEGANALEVARLLRPGDAVLLKGSRRVGLERIISAVRARAEGTPEAKPEIVTPAQAPTTTATAAPPAGGLFGPDQNL